VSDAHADAVDDVSPRLLGVLVTYRRPGDLQRHLDVLRKQSRRVAHLVVLDNAPDATNAAIVAGYGEHAPAIYVASAGNAGAAGGIAQGLRATLTHARDDDWIVLLDDDNPPRSDDTLEQLWSFVRANATDPTVGAIGLTGSRFDRRCGRFVRLRDDELDGALEVDFVGGNQFPMLRVATVRDVGVFRGELFWGLDDLDYGLRMRAAGYRVLVSGELVRWAREFHGRLGLEQAGAAVGTSRRPWRQYYTLRNLIDILRRNELDGVALRVIATRGLGKATVNMLRHPRRDREVWRLSLRAVRDGWRGTLGRTLDPS
jgi:GT2 family glycosyltransferase